MAVDQSVAPVTIGATTAPRPGRGHTVLFAATAMSGAGLLFVVQPLVARLLLPAYGGSATVWSTSSLFFQLLLLLAYAYAHWSSNRLGRRWQPRLHLVVLALPLVALPVAVPSDAVPDDGALPVLWLLRTLALVIGLPFAVVATTGPLLQRWYSWGDHRRSEDPYFLFAASNLGSFGGLLAYPFLIEPRLSLVEQRTWWSAGFVVFLVLTASCALTVRRPAAGLVPHRPARATERPERGRGQRRRMLTWLALAFLPSSFMLGVTSHISTDVAAVPLLWVVPLAIYLATFVVAFGRTSRTPPRGATRLAVAVAFALALQSVGADSLPVAVAIAANLAALALVAFAAHSRLASERPAPEELTAYFLVVAAGGALGGVLNGLVAPLVFDRVLEYPLVLVLVPLLMGGLTGTRGTPRRALVLGQVVLVLLLPFALHVTLHQAAASTLLTCGVLLTAVALGLWCASRPRASALALTALFVVVSLSGSGVVVERSRTFFGSYTVNQRAGVEELVHGTTIHGTQFRDPARRRTPTTYYVRDGPLGDVFSVQDPGRVGVVGLGVGTIAAYGRPGQSMTFFEIDPEIVRIARTQQLFTYLGDSEATVDTVVGDGRLELAKRPRGSFDLLVLDAFSSDAIPVHLLTEEAIRGYVTRLAPQGLLVVHVSNRMFRLEPVLAAAARDLGLSAAVGEGGGHAEGGLESTWVALARDEATLSDLGARPGWRPLRGDRVRWTNDYSSILPVLR